MIAARFINPFIIYAEDQVTPVRFEYELVIIDEITGEIYERIAQAYPWSVSDADLESIGVAALAGYIARAPELEPSTAPPVLDWPDGGPV